jgi:hypothetical protein
LTADNLTVDNLTVDNLAFRNVEVYIHLNVAPIFSVPACQSSVSRVESLKPKTWVL